MSIISITLNYAPIVNNEDSWVSANSTPANEYNFNADIAWIVILTSIYPTYVSNAHTPRHQNY